MLWLFQSYDLSLTGVVSLWGAQLHKDFNSILAKPLLATGVSGALCSVF